MVMETCPQCEKSITFPHARRVRDECGHMKCRICLIKDEDGCQTCEKKSKTNANRRKSRKKEKLVAMRTDENKEEKMLRQPKHLREEKTEEESDGGFNNNHEESEPNLCSPTADIADHANNNTDDKQGTNNSEEEIKETKDERKRKPLQIPSHITITPGNPTTYTCTICVKTFKRRTHVCYHNYCATGDKPFKCEYCNQAFVIRTHYDYHILSHADIRPFICGTCNKGFRQKDKLTRHMKTHTGEKPHVCQTCGKRFSESHSLKGHYRTHTGEKPYLCTQCGRRFADALCLRKHLIVHTGEKNFTCEDCGKRFGQRYALFHHQRSHSQDRPFQCPNCYRNFNTKKELKRHSIVHSDARPYNCSICNLTFRRKDNLERHMKNTHPETRMANYAQFDKDQLQPQQQNNVSNVETAINSEPPKSNIKSNRAQTIQRESSHTNVDNQKDGNIQSSQSQETSCIKSVPRAKDKEKIKPYVELVVPPSLLRKLPEPIEESPIKHMSEKTQKLINTTRNINKPSNSINNVDVTTYRDISDPIHSTIASLGPVHNLNIPGALNQVENLSSKGIVNPVQDLSTIATINSVQDLRTSGTINSVQDLSSTRTLVQNMNAIEKMNSIQDLSTSGILDSVQNLSDAGALNSVQDLSVSNYNPTNVISFKQMLVPTNSTSSFPGASLFQQIPDPIEQRSQAVPVINSPTSYTMFDYEGDPRTSDISSNYSNIIYNSDSDVNCQQLTYSDPSYDRNIETNNYPIINYISRPTIVKEKIIIERANCVPTITKASNVFPTNVSRSNIEQQTAVTNVNTNNQRYFSCKKTGKVLETDIEIPFTPTRTLQSDLHWRKRTIELSQQEQEMNDQTVLEWKRY